MNISNRLISTAARQRAAALLKELSLEEKVRQLGCTMLVSEDTDLTAKDLSGGIGEIALLDICEEPEALAARLRDVQQYVMEHSPHRIPALFHCEALGGPVVPHTVLYPNSIGLGATFDTALVRDMANTIRTQMRAMGILHALSPVLDVVKDLRWGRVNETYGGDPTLSAAMSCAFVQGLQGDDLSTGVAATAKHFLGYSQTVGGLNLTRTQADARELREVFAKPFEAAIRKAGIRTVMNSYSEWEGRPVCASRKLLTDLLRSELSFDGLVVSDYRSVQRLLDDILATADDITDAALQCLTAGLDMELPDRLGYADGMTHAFAEGKVDISYLDRAVLRVLTLKFELGLFDEPYPQWQQYHAAAFAPTAAAEQRATRESIVLTKNEGNTLPLTDRSIKLAVIGPGASSLRLLYGGYTQPSMLEMFQVVQDSSAMAGVGDKSTAKPVRKYDLAATDREIHKSRPEAKTIFEALQELYPNCTYTQGCDYLDPTQTDFAAALAAAESADAVILCLSGKNGWGRHCDTGEGNDAASLDLPGAQEELARVVLAANPRTIVTHTDGRPLTSPHIYANAAAILEAFTPGTWGGTELAALIAGIHSPAGCLPLPLPRTAGHKRGAEVFSDIADYCDELGVASVYFYAFSTENWKRPLEEVNAIMRLFGEYLLKGFDYKSRNIRIKFLGDRTVLDPKLQELMNKLEAESSVKTGMTLNIAINYGGRPEIVRAAQQLAAKAAAGELKPEDITEQMLSDAMYTAGQKDPDFILRPSGEKRLSNFMLWQAAYSELVEMDVLWPDFTRGDLDAAIEEFNHRSRRFGGL